LIAAKRMYRDLEDEMAYMTGLTYDIRKKCRTTCTRVGIHTQRMLERSFDVT
jgi:hypothetical protein